jgi:gentisate 1,2-dioxygenase
MRIIIESRGSYSVVNGKRHAMESGDIVLTPGGCWHGHGHDGTEQAYWVDCLDLPLVHLLEPMTAEEYPGGWEADAQEDPDSPMRISRSEVLRRLEAAQKGDAYFGRTVDLTCETMPTIGIKAHQWGAGWRSRPCRQHANQAFVVLGGSGTTHIGDHRFDWSFGDVFVAPLAARVAHTVHEDALIVTLNDERLMKFCGFYTLEDA